MHDFLSYLDEAFVRNYVRGEYDHTVEDLYRIVKICVRGEADFMEIAPDHIAGLKNGKSLWQLDIAKYEQPEAPEARRHWMIYRDAMRTILKRDARVRQHVREVRDTAEGVSYQFLLNSAEASLV